MVPFVVVPLLTIIVGIITMFKIGVVSSLHYNLPYLVNKNLKQDAYDRIIIFSKYKDELINY